MSRSRHWSADLFEALERGALVLTANARAARALNQTYAETQRSRGLTAWATPSIHDWQGWAASLWQRAFFENADLPLLLDPIQERVLWKRIQQRNATPVVSPEGMARLAQQAYRLLSEYEAHEQRRYPWTSLDHEHFRSWANAFDSECSRHGWASSSRCEELLAALAADGRIPVPAEVFYLGFDRILPAQQQLLDALRDRGVRLHPFLPELSAESVSVVSASDFRQEVSACADWCRDQLEADSSLSIGVLVPNLDSVRAEVERTFRNALMPESSSILIEAATPPYEFSLGMPLTDVPAVRAALLLLKWLSTPLPEEEVTWLLLSGFLSSSERETLTLASLDAKWRDSGSLSPELPIDTLLRRLTDGPPVLRERLQQVVGLRKEKPRRWSAWAELVPQILQRAGWPGYRTIDSAQYQAQQRFDHLLDRIATLDYDGSQAAYAEFVRMLAAQAAETIFSLESHDAPIQVLGAMESSGQRFDALWFLGVDDQAWPPKGRPHPLLPGALQRKRGMPHASPQLDWQLAHAITERIAASGHACVFSYSRQNRDGELRCSPLISPLAEEIKLPLALVHAHTPALEKISDDSGVLPWPQELPAGGSEVLKRQAACPFQAFAMTRLHASALNRTERGLTAAERGKLLHRTLEVLWREKLSSRDHLVNTIASGALPPLLREAAAAVFRPLFREAAEDSWMLAYLDAEQERLISLLGNWFALEAQRDPFTVEEAEKRLDNVEINGLRLNLRADRIDRLPDGGQLLIDYKTSVVSASAWKGERPEEPQLPVYALFGGIEDLRGVLFAQLRANELKFEGLTDTESAGHFAALPKDSVKVGDIYENAQPEAWESALFNLAADFLRGEAVVDPLHAAATCRYCPLTGLCRIAEIQMQEEVDE